MACRKCGKDHYNFVKCEDAKEASPQQAPDRFFRPREGERDWGNVTHTYQAHGSNVVFIPRKSHPHYTPPKDAA